MSEALYFQDSVKQDYIPLVAVLAGLVILMADSRAGVVVSDAAISEKTAVCTEGIFDVASASATLFAAGEDVWWDDTNNLAVKTGAATATFRIGTATVAKISGDLTVRTDLNSCTAGGSNKVAELIADSAAVTTTVTETVVATFTVPASFLKTGSVLDFLAAFIATATNSTDTFQFRIRLGGVAGTVIADSTAIDLANNDVCVQHGHVVIRTDGASGTFIGASQSQCKTTSNPVVTSSTAIDTTVGTVTLVATITESVSSAGNSAVCRAFNVFKR